MNATSRKREAVDVHKQEILDLKTQRSWVPVLFEKEMNNFFKVADEISFL